jgi:nucleotide-binding universal stress UspA family protein
MRARDGSAEDTFGIYLEKEYISRQKMLMGLGETLRKTIGADEYQSLSLHFHLPQGAAQKMIPELAVKLGADIVVMGTVARTGISGLIIGNTAETILYQLECSVLASKPAGFITPVTVTD